MKITYLIVEEVSKTIGIINSRDVSVYIHEFIISIVFLGFMGYTSRKRTQSRLSHKLSIGYRP